MATLAGQSSSIIVIIALPSSSKRMWHLIKTDAARCTRDNPSLAGMCFIRGLIRAGGLPEVHLAGDKLTPLRDAPGRVQDSGIGIMPNQYVWESAST